MPEKRIGDMGKYGRILIRGEYGHDFIDELALLAGELVIDKPGKGAFYSTRLEDTLLAAGITQLLVTGVTTEVCVHTTVREANNRGFECLVVSDCVGYYFREFQRVGLDMIKARGDPGLGHRQRDIGRRDQGQGVIRRDHPRSMLLAT